MLTLHAVHVDPDCATWQVALPDRDVGVLRPLVHADETELTEFLSALGAETRVAYDVEDPSAHARDMCEAIDRFDKLRLVLESSGRELVGLFELSFGLPEGDLLRYESYGRPLRLGTDVRVGLCLADDLQGTGTARRCWPMIEELAGAFGCTRLLLWGGVYSDNTRAIEFYQRAGFERMGLFENRTGRLCVDMLKTND